MLNQMNALLQETQAINKKHIFQSQSILHIAPGSQLSELEEDCELTETDLADVVGGAMPDWGCWIMEDDMVCWIGNSYFN